LCDDNPTITGVARMFQLILSISVQDSGFNFRHSSALLAL
jgi:hypothetical protein